MVASATAHSLTPVVEGEFIQTRAGPDAVEAHCTIQRLRIAVKDDIQGLKAAATTGITRDHPDIGNAESLSRRITMKLKMAISPFRYMETRL